MPPRRPVARTPAPCVPAPWTRWAAYGGMQASCGGQGTAWALPGRERAPGTRESPGERPRPGRRGCRCLPRAPTMGPGPALPRPWFTAGECLLRTPRTGGRRFPHRGRGSSSGGLRSQRSHSIFGWFCTDWRVEAAGSKSAALWQGGGVAGEARLLASQAGHGPDSPQGGRVRGRGSRPPARRDRSTWRGTVAGPSSRPQVPSSSLALCLCGGGRAAGKCGPRENARSSGWQGGLPLTLTPAQGPCEPGLISQGRGTLPGGMLVVGGPACACAAPPLGPKTTQPRLGQKPSPGRLPPVLPSVKGDPCTDGRTGGSSQWRGRDGGVCGFAAT